MWLCEAEVYESLYSDMSLNILGLALFPSAQDIGMEVPIDGAVEDLAK